MGISAYLRVDYNNLDKPFIIEGRQHDLGGTDYWTIARLSHEDAMLLESSGLAFKNGPFTLEQYEAHQEKLKMLLAERDLRLAQKRVDDLKQKQENKNG